jgi:hypothetical protein
LCHSNDYFELVCSYNTGKIYYYYYYYYYRITNYKWVKYLNFKILNRFLSTEKLLSDVSFFKNSPIFKISSLTYHSFDKILCSFFTFSNNLKYPYITCEINDIKLPENLKEENPGFFFIFNFNIINIIFKNNLIR